MTNTHNLYLQRINLVLNHIRHHLADDLSLESLAAIAGFSPYHFHRIFMALTGETLNQCTTRLRLDRAAALLKTDPTRPILDIALETGFSSASVFTRTFKKHFGFPPRQWNRESPLKNSKNGQVLDGFSRYTVEHLNEIADEGEFRVQLRDLPPQKMAYLRVYNSYQPNRILAAYDRFIAWYCAGGGQLSATTLIGMSQDDPEITPLPLCRYDFCLIGGGVENLPPTDEIAFAEFPACHIAYIHVQGDIFVVDRAWQYLYRYWLPHSRFQPDNRPAMEIYHRQPAQIGWEIYDLECAVPVVDL